MSTETASYKKEEWRVVRWGDDGETVEYRDGTKKNIDTSNSIDHAGYVDWATLMWCECADDCEAAGVPELSDHYDLSNREVPTRWRSAESMPVWAARDVP